ncbi:MAG: adenylate kinase [Candidatus Anoxychlamydiales bacterium]|nr:adenylate kinase [Candidatus Anoxychlamydiales bacterium]
MKKIIIYLLFFLITALGVIFMHQMSSSKKNIKDKELVVIMLGPPGAGKGTHGIKLSAQLNLPHISTGDLFRENIKKETDLGKEALKYIKEGNLTPDNLVIDMLFDHIKKNNYKNGYILDGFPRTVNQAQTLENRLNNKAKIIALSLDIDKSLLLDRITNRVMCSKCHTPYNNKFMPPKKEGICDKCGAELFQRKDDTKEVVEQRLVAYNNETKPLIDYYNKKDELKSVDANGSMEVVYSNLLKALDLK